MQCVRGNTCSGSMAQQAMGSTQSASGATCSVQYEELLRVSTGNGSGAVHVVAPRQYMQYKKWLHRSTCSGFRAVKVGDVKVVSRGKYMKCLLDNICSHFGQYKECLRGNTSNGSGAGHTLAQVQYGLWMSGSADNGSKSAR